jgi:hypothetical protein
MNKERRKLQKRKAREQEVKNKLLVQRQQKIVQARQERERVFVEQAKAAHEQMMKRFAEVKDSLAPEVREQIEKNIEIYKALEEEHRLEMAQKKKLNQKLEESGHITPKEKIEALQKIAIEETKRRVEEDPYNVGTFSGSAEVRFVPNNQVEDLEEKSEQS